MHRLLRRILCLAPCLLVSLACWAPTVNAGTWTASYNFVNNPGAGSGWYWQSQLSGQNALCGLGLSGCPGVVLGQSTVGVGAWSRDGVIHSGGQASRVAFANLPNVTVTRVDIDFLRVVENNGFMRVRFAGRVGDGPWGVTSVVDFAPGTIQRNTQTFTSNLSGGFSMELVNSLATNHATNPRNGFSLKYVTVYFSEGTAPTVESTAGAAFGDEAPWVTGVHCASAVVSDVGSGVASVGLLIDGGLVAQHANPLQDVRRPGIVQASNYGPFCVNTDSLANGLHTAAIIARDASGEQSVMEIGPLKVDRTQPSIVTAQAPKPVVTDRTPTFRFTLAPGPSGIAETGGLVLLLDGKAVAADLEPAPDGTLTVQIEEEIGLGDHTWSLRMVTRAGRATEVKGTFKVMAPSSTMKITPVIVPETTTTNRAPTFRFRVAPGSDTLEDLSLAIDGIAQGDFTADTVSHAVDPEQPLAYGLHTWEVIATSTAGTIARLEGRFTILSPAAATKRLRLVVPKQARAKGGRIRVGVRVVQNGNPVRNRQVTCKRGSTTRRVRTNRKGTAVCVLPVRGSGRHVVITSRGIAGRRLVRIVT